MRHVSLFTGIGGFELAASRVWGDDYEPVLFCEMDKYCQKVLNKHWSEVPIIGDVRDVKKENVPDAHSRGLEGSKKKRRDCLDVVGDCKARSRGKDDKIDLLTGGFPCQPFSAAGKRDGRSDNRHLWPEMLRVIQELKPAWVVAENVRGILSIEDGMVFEQVCLDLENAGYEVQPFVIPAVAVDAHHRRDRVWFVAHFKKMRSGGGNSEQCGDQHGRGIHKEEQEGDQSRSKVEGCSRTSSKEPVTNSESSKPREPAERKRGKDTSGRGSNNGGAESKGGETEGCCRGHETVSNSDKERLQRIKNNSAINSEGQESGYKHVRRSDRGGRCTWLPEPELGRVAHGIPCRVDRLKCLGNAIVPKVAEQIFRAIKETQ